MITVPAKFMKVRYDGARYPGAPGVTGIESGANCQQFAYELLRHFGFAVPDLRSSELWSDRIHTTGIENLEPLDLLLFSDDGRAWGAHVGAYLGEGSVLHLCAEAGFPEVRDLAWFREVPRYRTFLGAKRCHKAIEKADFKSSPAGIHRSIS